MKKPSVLQTQHTHTAFLRYHTAKTFVVETLLNSTGVSTIQEIFHESSLCVKGQGAQFLFSRKML